MILYKCKTKNDIDIIFNKLHKIYTPEVEKIGYYKELEYYGCINVFINTDTNICFWCTGICDSCSVNSTCDSVNATFVNPTIYDRTKKLERICNDK